jgi:hypothetical protein
MREQLERTLHSTFAPKGNEGLTAYFPDKEFREKEEVIKLLKEKCG